MGDAYQNIQKLKHQWFENKYPDDSGNHWIYFLPKSIIAFVLHLKHLDNTYSS